MFRVGYPRFKEPSHGSQVCEVCMRQDRKSLCCCRTSVCMWSFAVEGRYPNNGESNGEEHGQ